MWTVQDAKNRFSAVVEAALKGAPQEVSRRGKPAVVVLAAEDYQRLLAAAGGKRDSFAAQLLAFPGLEAGDTPRLEARPRDIRF